jgi:DNA recombination protein RmuC
MVQGDNPVEIVIATIVLAVMIAGVGAMLMRRLRASTAAAELAALAQRIDRVAADLSDRLAVVTGDMAGRIERVRGDLQQQIADRMSGGFTELASGIGRQLAEGRSEQASALKLEISALSAQTRDSLGEIRREIDEKLLAISGEVQRKLNDNIREGFQQFEKVQQHLKAAEEQLRNVGAIGASINDLNNLLKMPHLRGKFGEASLERLLADFLPASMYELQAGIGQNGQARPDAVIKFADRVLPIDAKFPREQVLPLFESNDPHTLDRARAEFVRVMKEQARRIAGYIHPENGTMEMALMYLPSETLFMEAVLSGELGEALDKLRVYPVSPNTLIFMLRAISMVYKMYEFSRGFEKATDELRKAQKTFSHFENRFEDIGKSLIRAQEAYEVARNHLTRYRTRVAGFGAAGELQPSDEPDGD